MTTLPGRTRSLISIITPTYNAGNTLAETLRSVEGQMNECTEHLLIDACSSDGTLETSRAFGWLNVTSEPDQGIYDGMNKGAALASGEWLLFLQADDWLPEGALEAYRHAITIHSDADMICGSSKAIKEVDGTWRPVWFVENDLHKRLTVENVALGEPMINARLIRKECFQRLGGFSTGYSLASDRDFLIRAALQGTKQIEIPEMTYQYRWHAGSSTMTEGNELTNRLSGENLAIAKKYLRQLSGVERSAVRRWHDKLTIQAGMNALESYDWGGLVTACLEGFRANRLWPASFVAVLASSLPGFLMRGGKTRSQLLKEKRMS